MRSLLRTGLATLFGLIAAVSGLGCTTGTVRLDVPFAAREQWIEAGGYRVAYVRAGSGPTIVLLHGGGTWSYSWRHNVDALARSHDVIALDFIGHGFTRRISPDAASYDFDQTSSFLLAALDSLNVQQADFVGNSWGGGWALAFAQDHPDRVRRLVLIGSSGVPQRDRWEWELLRWPVIGDIVGGLVRRSDVADGLRAAVADPASITDSDVSAVYAPLTVGEVQAGQVGFMRQLDFRRTASRLHEIKQPALVLWGELDRYVTLNSQEQICHALPSAALQVIAEAGHVAHEDRPDLINRLIINFFADGAATVKRDARCGASRIEE
jgi:pimeloyl-ACP methyl ester carboxylesterase